MDEPSKTNQRMRGLLQGIQKSMGREELAPGLRSLIDQGLRNVKHCTILAAFANAARLLTVEKLQDRTGFECFVNHIHLKDYVRGPMEAQLRQALLLLDELKRLLREAGPRQNYEFVVGCNDDGCIVRFHTLWPSETYLDDDLESYSEDALLVSRLHLPMRGH